MRNNVFNTLEYLSIEAERLAGQVVDYSSQAAAQSTSLVARNIKDSGYKDLVSVYGYPDFYAIRRDYPAADLRFYQSSPSEKPRKDRQCFYKTGYQAICRCKDF